MKFTLSLDDKTTTELFGNISQKEMQKLIMEAVVSKLFPQQFTPKDKGGDCRGPEEDTI